MEFVFAVHLNLANLQCICILLQLISRKFVTEHVVYIFLKGQNGKFSSYCKLFPPNHNNTLIINIVHCSNVTSYSCKLVDRDQLKIEGCGTHFVSWVFIPFLTCKWTWHYIWAEHICRMQHNYSYTNTLNKFVFTWGNFLSFIVSDVGLYVRM